LTDFAMKRKPAFPLAPVALRRSAETRLRLRSARNHAAAEASRSTADTRRLLHELQVHQIELEMQNEELREARDKMEAGLEKYSELYDFAPIGYLTLDHAGGIREANLAAASLLGVPRAPLMQRRLMQFVAPADRGLFANFLGQVFAGQDRRECDLQLLLKEKPPVDVRLRANLFESGQACRMAVLDITAHKRAAMAAAQLAAIVSYSSDAIVGQDLNGIVTSWNAGAEKLFGYSAAEMIGHPISRLISSDRRHEDVHIMSRIRKGESVEHIETARVAKDGRQLAISMTVSPVQDGKGGIIGASKVARDITGHKQAQERMRVSEIRYRRLFEAAQDGILILDPKTRCITDANPFIVRLLGYSRSQLLRKELWQIGLLKDEAASQQAFRELKAKGFIRYEDLPLESKAGRRHEVEFVSNLYDEDGVEVIQCNVRDITERKRTENALIASEERYRVLFDLGPVGVYSCDAAGMIRDFNRSAVALWGRKPKLGHPRDRFCGSLAMYLPNGRRMPHAQCPMALVLSGKMTAMRDGEVIIERPDGSRITVIVNIVPLKNERGEITGAINCFYDITDRKRAEEALREARATLAAHAVQLEGLVATRTVELTATNRRLETSIVSVKKAHGQNRLLLEESHGMQKKLRQLTHQIITAQEEERKQISRELHDEVVQLLVGINVELSALGKNTSAGQPGLKGKITRIQRLVENSVDAVHGFARGLRPAVLDDLGLIPALHAYCKNLAVGKKFKIRLTAFGGVEALDGAGRTMLFRVAQEALTNVTRHAQATQVALGIAKIPGAIRMEVTDNGKSFRVEKILLARNNKRLGLVGMRERVEMVGGTLAIESAPGQGTTVRVEIPFIPPPPRSSKK
jgi:two-component system sensor histidine kinase DegS